MMIDKQSSGTRDEEPMQSEGTCSGSKGDNCHQKTLLNQDLNCIPYSLSVCNQSEGREIELNESDSEVTRKRRRRATPEEVANIALEDLTKYFDLTLLEASRNLKVGLTALKKKCRELGIPRWPHRKIKSLDSLIHNLQEEAERQKQENDDAAAAVLKSQRMLEKEKETIESKPSMEIQSETKRFRQDVFKRRHRARALQNQDKFAEKVYKLFIKFW